MILVATFLLQKLLTTFSITSDHFAKISDFSTPIIVLVHKRKYLHKSKMRISEKSLSRDRTRKRSQSSRQARTSFRLVSDCTFKCHEYADKQKKSVITSLSLRRRRPGTYMPRQSTRRHKKTSPSSHPSLLERQSHPSTYRPSKSKTQGSHITSAIASPKGRGGWAEKEWRGGRGRWRGREWEVRGRKWKEGEVRMKGEEVRRGR